MGSFLAPTTALTFRSRVCGVSFFCVCQLVVCHLVVCVILSSLSWQTFSFLPTIYEGVKLPSFPLLLPANRWCHKFSQLAVGQLWQKTIYWWTIFYQNFVSPQLLLCFQYLVIWEFGDDVKLTYTFYIWNIWWYIL